MRLDPDQLFERATIGGTTYEFLPTSVYDANVIGRGDPETTLTFIGHPGSSADELHKLVENQILDRALDFHETHTFILEQLGLDPAHSWCLIGERRCNLLPSDPGGKPGDFDLIAGRVRDGIVAFDYLAEAEIKIRKVHADGRPASFASGRGTKQAVGAAQLGFDRTLLLHILVREGLAELPPDHAPSWTPLANADFFDSVKATIGLMAKSETDVEPPYGYAILGWGHVPGTEPSLCGALCPVRVRPAPLLPLRHSRNVAEARQLLEKRIRSLIGECRPPARFIRRCAGCPKLFAPRRAQQLRCIGCK